MLNKIRIALAGNPNTGKSTLFNVLTGLRQHTGNWPGKTVLRAEGDFTYNGQKYQIIDLPGTYSLFSNSADEETARDYIIFEQPDVTIVVIDATAIERNLNLALQVMEMTNRVLICINLIDEAKKMNIEIDVSRLEKRLGVPIAVISARTKEGIEKLLQKAEQIAGGQIVPEPCMISYDEQTEASIRKLEPTIRNLIGDRLPVRWVALRLLDGDEKLLDSIRSHFAQQSDKKEVLRDGSAIQPQI